MRAKPTILTMRPYLLLAGVVLMCLSACSRITPENFDKIKVGMTSDQVKAILGSPTESQTQGALGLI
jgi:outer membrane protein assembly factor BamE (lipoprotein component of BamABCDE complex)